MITLNLKTMVLKNWIYQLVNKLLQIIFLYFLLTANLLSQQTILARSAILIDYHSGDVLFEKEADSSIHPASMTKIMTTIVAFDLLNNNKIALEDKAIISEKAWRMSQSGYSSMFIMVNDEVSVENLLKGIIVASGNDACVALAEFIAGSEENFADIMNEKAFEIGMVDTNFANSSGINHPDNFSTVRDIALMSKYLIKNYPEYYPIYKEKYFTWDRTGGEPIKQSNRNGLLYKKKGADGIKTGYLAVEKYSLASTIKKNTRRLIAVGSGFDSVSSRTSESIKLLEWGFRNTTTYEVSNINKAGFNIKTWLGSSGTVIGKTKKDVFITLSKKDIRNFKAQIVYEGPIKAPIYKGEEIAKINIYKKNELISSVPIYASEDVKKINFFKSVFTSLNYLIWGDV